MKKISINDAWQRTIGEKPKLMSLNPAAPTRVSLPDDYIITMERSKDAISGASSGFFPGGRAFYSRSIDVPESWTGKSVLLDIDGAYENAEVTLNDEPLGVHPYGYTPWQISLDDVIIPGENNTLEIDTRDVQPNCRWYSGGGLYRQISLYVGEPCHIRPWDIFLTTPVVSEESSTLHLNVTVTNTASEAAFGTLTLAVEDSHISVPVQIPADNTKNFDIELLLPSVSLWSAEEPHLHEAVITLDTNFGVDTSVELVGFRHIEIDALHGMRVNGNPVKLLGGCIHHDNTFLGAAAYPAAEKRKLMKLKSAGYNAVRLAHNPPSGTFLDLCDKIGVYVIDEAFDCWKISKNDLDYHLYYAKWWQDDMAAMIRRDRNHPSIFCWSIGNELTEIGGRGNGPQMIREMSDYVRTLDHSRPITCAFHSFIASKRTKGQPSRIPFALPASSSAGTDQKNNAASSEEAEPSIQEALEAKKQMMAAMMNDPNALEKAIERVASANKGDGFIDGVDVWGDISASSAEPLDIIGYNYFHPRYKADHENYPNRVICATETRASETYDCYQAMMENDAVIGDFIWTAYDNLGEAGAGRVMHSLTDLMTGMLGPWPYLSCYQGDFDLAGNRRPQSYYREIMWGKGKGIHVFAKDPKYANLKPLGLGWEWNDVFESWSFGKENAGKDIYVEAYSDCDEIEFLVNSLSAGRFTVDKLKASAVLKYEEGIFEAVAYKNNVEIARSMLRTASAPASILLTAESSAVKADDMDLAFINIEILDANGVIVPSDSIEVHVNIENGSLAGLGSGNPCTDENYGTGSRRVWGGKAVFCVSASFAGEIHATVSADGLEDASITIQAD